MAAVMDISDTEQHEPVSHEETSRRPEATRGAAIRCHACKHRNSATQKYCTECGQLLWEPCVVCETSGPVGQAYCGSCGSCLDTARRNKVGQLEKQLTEAERLRDESHFQKASDLLKNIIDVPFSCVVKEVQRAKQLLSVCNEEHLSARANAEKLTAEAEQHLRQTDFQAAAGLLQRIPQAVRGDAMQSMLDTAQDRLAEIDRLCGEIETAMNSRLTLEIPPKVSRLLELQPAHEKAQLWAKKLKQQLLSAAQEKIKRFRYDKAEELLLLIPRAETDQQIETIRRETADLADMEWDIRKSVLVDGQLPAIAELLAKRVPNHPQTAAWLKNMANRIQAAGNDFRQGLPPWATAPKQPRLGCPIERPTGFRKFDVGASAAEMPCRQHAGRFYAACGLALQGLAQAALDINLMPENHGGILRHVSRLRRSHHHGIAWGLDLGASGLKAVKLAWDDQQQKARIEECYMDEFPKNLDDIADTNEKDALIQDSLKNFRQKYTPQNECLAVSLPGRQVLYRVLALPPMNPKKLDAAVQYEARRVFPLPLEQLALSFRPLGNESQNAKTAETEKQTILLAAAKRSSVEQRLAIFQQAGLRAGLLQSDSLALLNHFNFEAGPPDDGLEDPKNQNADCSDGREAVAVFDIGSNTSNFLVHSPTCVWAHSVGLGSNKVNQCLMRRFGLAGVEAEALKRRPHTAPSLRQWHEAVLPVFESLAQEITWSTATFAKLHHGIRITHILGTGGGFQTHGLLRYLHHGR